MKTIYKTIDEIRKNPQKAWDIVKESESLVERGTKDESEAIYPWKEGYQSPKFPEYPEFLDP